MKNIFTPQNRGINHLAGFLACTGMMGFALYQQYFQGQEPCHLCVLQRIAVIALGLVFGIAALDGFVTGKVWERGLFETGPLLGPGPEGRSRVRQNLRFKVYLAVLSLIEVAGMGAAGRQVWLQAQPPGSVAGCGAPLEMLVQMFGVPTALYKTFMGGADCQDITWTLLGLHTPAWVLICLLGLTAWAIGASALLKAAKSSRTKLPTESPKAAVL